MRSYLLGGIAVASAFTFMIASAPASAQGCGMGHPCVSPRAGAYHAAGAGPGQFRYQQHSYGHGYGRGHDNGIGLGIGAALVTGAIIGGAMEQNQGYYPVESYPVESYPVETYPTESYPVSSDQGPLYDAGGALVADDGGSVAYCQQTYRSYDPASGTYLGYDGMRHACP